jgi:DeoR/GlpR family transcriptional regulator of sugar metabolism
MEDGSDKEKLDTQSEDGAGAREFNISDRRSRIVQMVNRNGAVRVADLSRHFGISEVTIRNDLCELERMDLLERTHGGASRSSKSYYRLTLQERLAANRTEKQAIAGHVANMVNEGDTLFLNSGSTSCYVAQCLRGVKNLLVVTNSPMVAQEIGYTDCEVVLVGGSFNAPLSFTFGDDAVNQIAKYRANKFIFACDGVSAAAGIMTYNTHEVYVNRKFMENSSMIVAVADYSKIGRCSRIAIEPVACLDTLVTNSCADACELGAIKAMGVEIVAV